MSDADALLFLTPHVRESDVEVLERFRALFDASGLSSANAVGILSKVDRLAPDGDPWPVAHRLAVSRWRKAVRTYRSPDRAVEERSSREPSPDKVVLQQAMAQLPYEQRRALVLHYIADLSIDDIAEEVGAPSGTIKARLSRGRKALASLLGDESEVRHA